jgi:hypothetical protein
LAAIVQAEPESADDVFLVAQDADGSFVGDTLYGSSLHAAASRSDPPAAALENAVSSEA